MNRVTFYRLMGKHGLTQTGLKDKRQPGEIEFFIRSGGHGVRVTDWNEMLDFLDRWLVKPPAEGINAIARPRPSR